MEARDGRNASLRPLPDQLANPDRPDRPDRGDHLPRGWLAAWAGLLWTSAPLLPALRNYLNENAAGDFNRYVAVGLLAAAAVVVAVTWILTSGRRLRAFGTLVVLCVTFGLIYHLLSAPDPRSRVVEAAHFVQYGTLAFLAVFSLRRLSRVARWAQSLLLVVVVGVVDEFIQWLLATRFAEIRDLAVNVAAGAFGILYAGLVLNERGSKSADAVWPTRTELQRVVIGGALVLTMVGAFMYFVHLGHWIRWNKVEFISQYRAEELDRTSEQRRTRWSSVSASELGGLLRPAEDLWGIEDFYVTEARRHIQARNQAADAGDAHVAAGENQIVERWYTPYLEIAGARRTDLPAGLDTAYRSNVLAHLWPWLASPSVWGTLIVAELALVGLALRLGSTR